MFRRNIQFSIRSAFMRRNQVYLTTTSSGIIEQQLFCWCYYPFNFRSIKYGPLKVFSLLLLCIARSMEVGLRLEILQNCSRCKLSLSYHIATVSPVLQNHVCKCVLCNSCILHQCFCAQLWIADLDLSLFFWLWKTGIMQSSFLHPNLCSVLLFLLHALEMHFLQGYQKAGYLDVTFQLH